MTICITGAYGFIGKYLVRRLLAEGNQLRLISRVPRKPSEQIEIFNADLVNPEARLSGLFEQVSVFYHCAGEVNNALMMRPLHVDGTQRLLDEAQKHILRTGQSLHWVQLSSVGVYGPPVGKVDMPREVGETSPLHPSGEYETTKSESDQLVLQLATQEPRFTCSILRPSIVVASDMPNQSVKSLVNAIRRGKFFYIGTTAAISTYVHVEDVIDALLLIGQDARAKGHIFNLSNDCCLCELVEAIHRYDRTDSHVFTVPVAPLRLLVHLLTPIVNLPLTQERIDAMINRTRYPNRKIREILDYSPARSIPEIIANLFYE